MSLKSDKNLSFLTIREITKKEKWPFFSLGLETKFRSSEGDFFLKEESGFCEDICFKIRFSPFKGFLSILEF